MKSTDLICLETCMESYKSRLRNNNIDLHMVLYSCNHCFEYNPNTKEIRPFNSIFWYNMDEGPNENKYSDILEYLRKKHEEARNTYPYNKTSNPIGIVLENTLAVDMNKLVQDIIPKENIKNSEDIINECNIMISSLEEMYRNWKDIMLFVLNNYDGLNKVAISKFWRG